jgi:hypothetical protein
MRGVLLLLLLLATGACEDRALGPTDAAAAGRDAAGLDGSATFEKRVLEACAVVTGCAPEVAPSDMFPVDSHHDNPAACVAALASQGLPGFASQGFSWSSLWDHRMIERLLSCADKHRGACDPFHACYGGTWGGSQICRYAAACRGSQIVYRGDPLLYFDCASFGGSCKERDSKRACCTTVPCVDFAKCLGPAQLGRCHDGVYWEFACEPFGAQCVTYGAYPTVACVGNDGADGETCSATGSKCLSPTKVRYCLRTRYHTYDCAQHPFFKVCGDPFGSSPAPPRPGWPEHTCVGADYALSSSNLPWSGSRCEGDTLVIELMGYRGKVSCKKLGFGSCSQATKSHARCKP